MVTKMKKTRVPKSADMVLPAPLRAPFEQAFAMDFSPVKIHTDSPRAAGSTQALLDHDTIHFAPGRFSPDTMSGRKLLAHELAHVAQQRRGGAAPGGIDARSERGLREADADRAASLALAGRPARVTMQASPGLVHRFDSYEHKLLGDAGGRNLRLECGVWLSYGQAVALSGDFYGSVDALMKAPRDEVVRLLDMIDREGAQAVRNQARHGGDPRFGQPSGKESAANEEEAQSATSWRERVHYGMDNSPSGVEGQYRGRETRSYATLAKHNSPHFTDENLELWRKEHEVALDLARRAHRAGDHSDPRASVAQVNEAYLHDAFACHFLTDSFSSGHLVSGLVGRDEGAIFWRENKDEILKDLIQAAEDDHDGGLPPELMGLIKKVVDEDAPSLCLKLIHDYLNENGVKVRNAAGTEWVAYGDRNLARSPETVTLGQQAVRLSRQEVDEAVQGGPTQSHLSPLELVPCEVSYGGEWVPIHAFKGNRVLFEAILRPLVLTPRKDNALYQLMKGNLGFATGTIKEKAIKVGRDLARQIEPVAR
jgi:hypothetical protein